MLCMCCQSSLSIILNTEFQAEPFKQWIWRMRGSLVAIPAVNQGHQV